MTHSCSFLDSDPYPDQKGNNSMMKLQVAKQAKPDTKLSISSHRNYKIGPGVPKDIEAYTYLIQKWGIIIAELII